MREQAFRALLLMLACILITACGCSSSQNNAPGGQDADGASSDAANAPPPAEDPPPEEVECDWTLEVSDTQTSVVNGYNFTCTLTIMAVKLGGKDALGKYSGLATLQYEYDMQNGAIGGNAKGGGQDNYAEFEIAAYSVEEQLAPLVTYDAMSSGSFIFSGSGEAAETVEGVTWSTNDSKSVEVPFTMEVDGGQVSIELPSIAPGVSFKGIITGTPS